MSSNIFSMSINKTNNLPIIVGNTYSLTINLSNSSPTKRLYNLNLSLVLPDGLTLNQSSIPQTSTANTANNTTTYSWINLKDLAALETNYSFTISIKCNTKFKNNNPISFGYNFSGIKISAQIDTMPRGIYDIGNEIITSTYSLSFITRRFNGTVFTSSKVLKGAGTLLSLNDYTQINTATYNFTNNAISSSTVNIRILLNDGIRYIGNISSSGKDSNLFLNPIINTVIINGKLYTEIYFSNIKLSINSNTTLKLNYCVWNRYNNNSGEIITHGSKLKMLLDMGLSEAIASESISDSFEFSAMDMIILTSINKNLVDIQNNVTFNYTFKVGQYYDIQNILITYMLPDGVYYLSSNCLPFSIVDSSELKGFLITYKFDLALKNSSRTISINAKIDSYYRYKFNTSYLNLPLVAYDSFVSNANINGNLVGLFDLISDSDSVNYSIIIGKINKKFIRGYYKDGTPKIINTLAPGDKAEYLLTYDASSLKATQKEIYLTDFFPLSTDPINDLSYVYTGNNPISNPKIVEPHGVDFYYGDSLGLALNTINFKVPIALLGTPSQNINLLKLRGINTSNIAYSSRTQVTVNIGSPNLTLTKTVSGPNRTAIQSNEIYTFTVTLTNTSNLGTETDAFDFNLNDVISSNWFSYNPNSLSISGTGSYNEPQINNNNNISMYINKLSPGNSIILKYSVTISNVLAPGVSVTTSASNTNPYSQIYNPLSDNFRYSNLNKTASATLSSLNVLLTKTNLPNTFKVGSSIIYDISLTVPKGTIAYNLYAKDILPNTMQNYIGPCYKNNSLISVTNTSNTITFPNEGTIDARLSSQSISYIFTCNIFESIKILNSVTNTQTNTAQCLYQRVQNSTYSSVTKTLPITINHPNILLSLSASNINTSTLYTSNALISINDNLLIKLDFKNNSNITLQNGFVEIPINSNMIFNSISFANLCNATFDYNLKKLIVSIPKLTSSQSGFITFSLLSKADLNSGTSFNMQAIATSYFNDINLSKIYSGETSNILNFLVQPNLSLSPDPLYKLNDSTSFTVTPPGGTVIILNYFKNTGGGYDSFSLNIKKSLIPYSLYIDDIKIADINSNTEYTEDLSILSNVEPNITKIIKITTIMPLDSLGKRYDFIVTAKSKTSPYPQKTVLNIDPS